MEPKTILLLGAIFLLLVLTAYLLGRIRGAKSTSVEGLPPDLLSIYQEIQGLPSKVLSTIQGSINPQKGKVAELLTYAELRHDYDLIIPLGKPFDFLGIKFDEKIDFIEVKSQKSQLSANEKAISNLIKKGNVNFRLIVIKDEEAKNLLKRND
jgi:hypothetical protein